MFNNKMSINHEKIQGWIKLLEDLSQEEADIKKWEAIDDHRCNYCGNCIESISGCYDTPYGNIVIGTDGEPHIFCSKHCWKESNCRLRILRYKFGL